MEIQKYPVKLNMKSTGIVRTGIRLKQGDSGMQLVFKILSGNADVYNSSELPKAVFKRPDGSSVIGECTSNGQQYIYTFKGNELEVPGMMICDVKFAMGTVRESTTSFELEVLLDTVSSNSGGADIYVNDLAGIEETVVKLTQLAVESAEVAKRAAAEAEATSGIGIMTLEKAGIGKPDGMTILVNQDGTFYVGAKTSAINLRGKTIAVFGSSNEVDGFSGGNNWVTYMSDYLDGIATVVNKSIPGYTITQMIDAALADGDLLTYDIILFTSVRNAFKSGAEITSLNSKANTGIIAKMESLYEAIDNLNQDIYFASCLPYADNWNKLGLPMCYYDGAIYKMCGNLGFKYLDMHNWLGISDADATTYTTDGSHYMESIMPILANKCINALNKGGESLTPYSCIKSDDEILELIDFVDGVTFNSSDYTANCFVASTDLSIKISMALTFATDISALKDIFTSKSGELVLEAFGFAVGYTTNMLDGHWLLRSFGNLQCSNDISAGTATYVRLNAKTGLDMLI